MVRTGEGSGKVTDFEYCDERRVCSPSVTVVTSPPQGGRSLGVCRADWQNITTSFAWMLGSFDTRGRGYGLPISHLVGEMSRSDRGGYAAAYSSLKFGLILPTLPTCRHHGNLPILGGLTCPSAARPPSALAPALPGRRGGGRRGNPRRWRPPSIVLPAPRSAA